MPSDRSRRPASPARLTSLESRYQPPQPNVPSGLSRRGCGWWSARPDLGSGRFGRCSGVAGSLRRGADPGVSTRGMYTAHLDCAPSMSVSSRSPTEQAGASPPVRSNRIVVQPAGSGWRPQRPDAVAVAINLGQRSGCSGCLPRAAREGRSLLARRKGPGRNGVGPLGQDEYAMQSRRPARRRAAAYGGGVNGRGTQDTREVRKEQDCRSTTRDAGTSRQAAASTFVRVGLRRVSLRVPGGGTPMPDYAVG